MVECRSLASVCRALEDHRNMANSLTLTDQLAMIHPQRHQHQHHQRPRKQIPPLQASSPPLCDQSSAAAIDIIILILVLGACGFLFTPYFKYVSREVGELLPATFLMIGEVVYQAPVAYASGALFMFIAVIGAWEVYQYKSRRCDNPHCRGLRKSTELDIQVETEQCLRAALPVAEELPWNGGMEIGHDQKELEAELRRMAPVNGRAVLIFRAPCGCPAARFEAWGSKKPRRSKK